MGCFAVSCLGCRQLFRRRRPAIAGVGARGDPPEDAGLTAGAGAGAGAADGSPAAATVTAATAGAAAARAAASNLAPSAPPAPGCEVGSSVSEISTASTRRDQMQYLMEELRLDRTSASIMYKAERLQERGQLRQALFYYNKVLEARPRCQEAAENARMTEQMLRNQQVALQADLNGRQLPPTGTRSCNTGRLEVFWLEPREAGRVYSSRDFDPVAIAAGHRALEERGYNTPFVTLVQNQILETTRDGASMLWSGRATVEATLVPTNCKPLDGPKSRVAFAAT